MKWLLITVLLMPSVMAKAQQIPLDSCNELSMMKVSVGKRNYQFLVDTGAVSTLLNLKSFSSADATNVTLESWNGTVGAQAREVVLPDVTIGDHKLFYVKLLSVDLTPLDRSCRRQVDGVLGSDLIKKLGMTIDLKNRVATFAGDDLTRQADFSELNRQQLACEKAFNESDAKTFADCLEHDIVMLTADGDFHGQKEVMNYLRQNSFGQDPPVHVSFNPLATHATGAVIWSEYEISVSSCGHVVKQRGTAVYHKTGDRWRLSSMNNSLVEARR